MHELTIKQVDVFTCRPFCGNPAGVITEADGLSDDAMQMIASEMKMNLIEIAYVTLPRSPDALFRVRFFTPTKELDCSGHALMASCFALIEDGKIELNDGLTEVNMETGTGTIPVHIHFRRAGGDDSPDPGEHTILKFDDTEKNGILDRIMIKQPIHEFISSRTPVEEIANVLGISTGDITATGLPLVTASHDFTYLIIPVKNSETILNMKPDLIKLGLLNRKYGVHTNHIFTLDTLSPDCISYSRHFGPALGFWEDPASAIPSAGLGTYLVKYGISTKSTMIMEQGNEIDSLSRIHVEIDGDGDDMNGVGVGGQAVTSIARKIDSESREIIGTVRT